MTTRRGFNTAMMRLGAAVVIPAAIARAFPTTAAKSKDEPPPGRIAFVRKGDIWVWHNGDSKRLIKDGAASDPRWSPTGRFILFVRSGDSYSDLILHDFADGTEVALTYNQSDAQPGSPDYVGGTAWVIDPDWIPTGLIAFASDATSDNSVILWLLPDPELPPEPAPSAQMEDNIEGVSLAADGSLAAYTVRFHDNKGGNHTYVAIRNLSDGTSTVLVDKPGGVFDPAISPDGQTIAIAIRAADGVSDIWIADRVGKLSRVTTGAQATGSSWSPDGRWLAYMRMIDYRFEVWAVPRNGGGFGEPRRLFRFKNLDATSRVSWTLT